MDIPDCSLYNKQAMETRNTPKTYISLFITKRMERYISGIEKTYHSPTNDFLKKCGKPKQLQQADLKTLMNPKFHHNGTKQWYPKLDKSGVKSCEYDNHYPELYMNVSPKLIFENETACCTFFPDACVGRIEPNKTEANTSNIIEPHKTKIDTS